MRKLYIFNPDTDYALASGSEFYTPTLHIREMIQKMTLFPSLWAEPESVVITEGNNEQALCEAHEGVIKCIHSRNIQICDFHNARKILGDEPFIACPWGWNPTILRRLKQTGINFINAPMEKWEERLLSSSREKTISLNCHLRNALPEFRVELPVKCNTIEEVLYFIKENKEGVFKDPWSSSGRGVCISTGLDEIQIKQWATGVIRRHGFVMAETLADRVSDFATLWETKENNIKFLGFSMFTTNGRGRYISQIIPDQNGLEYITRKNPIIGRKEICRKLIQAQKEWLESQPKIEGYASIDMLTERDGNIRPGIEVNRRMTMGTAALLIAQNLTSDISLPLPFLKINRYDL